ncbi:Protein of unknown function [Cotesia congregata]|uniref:Uncharacterized protein n=1 Tax=Cotesia congregata TaxID=51543 RepID=A0A8J2H835_COTCN|nr:Protein of unknown function [Cotesia congregata]
MEPYFIKSLMFKRTPSRIPAAKGTLGSALKIILAGEQNRGITASNLEFSSANLFAKLDSHVELVSRLGGVHVEKCDHTGIVVPVQAFSGENLVVRMRSFQGFIFLVGILAELPDWCWWTCRRVEWCHEFVHYCTSVVQFFRLGDIYFSTESLLDHVDLLTDF